MLRLGDREAIEDESSGDDLVGFEVSQVASIFTCGRRSKSGLYSERTGSLNDKRRRIHESWSFRAAVKTDADDTAAAYTGVRCGMPVICPDPAQTSAQLSVQPAGQGARNPTLFSLRMPLNPKPVARPRASCKS
jgi:hypothetical protein